MPSVRSVVHFMQAYTRSSDLVSHELDYGGCESEDEDRCISYVVRHLLYSIDLCATTVTLLSAAIIFAITTMEFFDYRRVHMDTSIAVDKSRGEKLVVKMNVTFPRVPCYCT